jgi:hypothetical protein
MRRLWAKRWFRVFSGCSAALCLAVLSACWYFRVWGYDDYQTLLEVRRYPPGEDLWFGRVQAGEDLARFAAAHPPHRVRRLGGFTLLSYYSLWPIPPGSIPMESLSVIAKDGRLVHAVAGGCTWHRVFFAMSAENEAELDEEFRQHWAQRDNGQ